MSVVEVDNLETIVGVDKFFVRHHNSYRMERNVDVVGSGRRMSLRTKGEYLAATHCDVLQHTVRYSNMLQHAATQYTATHGSYVPNKRQMSCCNTLQTIATYCNTLQNTAKHTAEHCRCLTATHCNKLQHTATPCSTMQRPATPCSTLH